MLKIKIIYSTAKFHNHSHHTPPLHYVVMGVMIKVILRGNDLIHISLRSDSYFCI